MRQRSRFVFRGFVLAAGVFALAGCAKRPATPEVNPRELAALRAKLLGEEPAADDAANEGAATKSGAAKSGDVKNDHDQ